MRHIRKLIMQSLILPTCYIQRLKKWIPTEARAFRYKQIAPSIILLILESKKFLTIWQRTHNIALRPRINALKQQIDSAIKNQLSNTWQRTLQGPDPIIPMMHGESEKKTWNSTNIIRHLKLNDRSAVAREEKVNLFADTLQDFFTTNPEVDSNFSKLNIKNTVRNFLGPPNKLQSKRVENSSSQTSQSSWTRCQTAHSIKDLPLTALKFTPTLCNASITNNYYPPHWRVPKIMMLLKPEKDNFSSLNYRPISLLNSLADVTEKIEFSIKRIKFNKGRLIRI